MSWMDFLAPAAALAATTVTGGAAAPALAATELGAAAAAPLAAPLVGEAAAAGAIAPTGFASILNPLGVAPGMGEIGGGMAGAANPFAAVGNMATATPPLPMGMTPGPLPGAAGLGSGLSGTGTFAEMPGAAGALDAGPMMKNAAALKPEQLAQLSRLMPGQQGSQAGGGGGGGLGKQGGGVQASSALTAPALGTTRPSLGAILGLRGAR